ncbi:DNA-binding transcriptional regulator, LysR family [Ectopseudomonas composti]|uniref:DNA-binding transcriptional regulator, LysR family n=1 Tax=Ectopseudomonas composti TaxID=658457 RepID=A0A1I5L413_9GAMM|nr:LysR family transcriptional regulator [Pseudomonas composti]SFO91938.1 DNA-binding transcriptional regulator, LysR family [Pseudomonas composti]
MINPLHFDLQSLRLFILAAESGSLTRASEHAHLTLSAVSKRIAELERTADCALFVRLPRGLELTPAGQGLLEHARTILEGVNRMASDISDFAVGVRGHVRVWANTSAVVQFLPRDIASFLALHPQVRIGLEEKLSEQIVEAVEDGKADIGVFADNVPAPGLERLPYRQDRLILLVPPGHPLAEVERTSFADTLDYDYVGLAAGSSLLRRLTDAAVAAEKILRLRIQVSSFDAICRMIEAGLGIGILPEIAVRAELLGAGLRAVQLSDPWAVRTLWLGVKSADALQPEARKLWDYLGQAALPTDPFHSGKGR